MLQDEHRRRKDETSDMLIMHLLLHQMKSGASILDAKGGVGGSEGLGILWKTCNSACVFSFIMTFIAILNLVCFLLPIDLTL
jgi:hypothetical protein